MIQHPLFWKEWKSAKWWCLLIMGVFLMMFLSLNNKLQFGQQVIGRASASGGYYDYMVIFENQFSSHVSAVSVILIPIVIIMVTLLFQSDRKESVGAFVSGLPFTKKQQFKVKWFVGMLTITIPFAITTLLTVAIRAANWAWIQKYYAASDLGSKIIQHDTWLAVMLTLLQVYLFFMTFYSLLMLIQTLIANNIAASVIGVIALAAPWFVIETGTATLSRLFNTQIMYRNNDWSLFYTLMNPVRKYIEIAPAEMKGFNLGVFSYDYYWLKIAILVIIAVLSLYLGIKAYAQNQNSRNGELIMFDWVGKVLLVGVTLCSALLGNNGLKALFIEQTNPVYEILTFTISGFIGFVIIQKISQTSRRCKA